MIVRRLESIGGTEREVSADNWTSRRLLLARDGMGFSLHDTVIRAGASIRMCYRNHLEAVYCVGGIGSIELISSGEVFAIAAGTLYALDHHDEHVLRAQTELRLVCVFNPPLVDNEVHDASGSYAAAKPSEE